MRVQFIGLRNLLAKTPALPGLKDRAWILFPLALFTLAGCAKSGTPHQPTAAAAVFTNPVYAGNMPDPSVIRHDGLYFAFGTTGAERTWDGRVFTTLASRDLVRWQRIGGALLPPSTDEHVQYW